MKEPVLEIAKEMYIYLYLQKEKNNSNSDLQKQRKLWWQHLRGCSLIYNGNCPTATQLWLSRQEEELQCARHTKNTGPTSKSLRSS